MTNEKTLILLTNDDGYDAPGLVAVAGELREIGRTIICAPERDKSAVSQALTMDRPLRVRKVKDDLFTIDGTPTDCVTIGIGKVLAKVPDLVVSGINPGGNLGDDISYSGTVSAAIEGTMHGVCSIAISLAGEPPFCFDTAAQFAANLAKAVLAKGLPKDTLLNVNVPNIGPDDIKGVRFTRQGRRKYEGAIKETSDPWGRKHYWIGGGTPLWEKGNDTDADAVLSGLISVTPLHLDLTNYEALDCLKRGWDISYN